MNVASENPVRPGSRPPNRPLSRTGQLPAGILKKTFAVVRLAVYGLAALLLLAGCSGPAPLDSAEAHSTADALYTAVTSRRMDLLDQVAGHLKELSSSGKLSAEALTELNAMIEQARAGDWQAAAEELDHFIRNQPPHQHSHSH